MTDDELNKRLALIEANLNTMRDVLSFVAAQGHATMSALCAILTVTGQHPELYRAVDQHLEQAIATNLAVNQNQTAVDVFDQTATYMRLAMQKAIEDHPKTGG